MSFDNTDGSNNTSSTGRREGLSDSRGGAESYGQGTGDPANTGLGQNQQRASADQTMQATDNFDNSSSQSQNSGAGAFGRDRSTESPSFSGSDSTYDKTATGATFGQRDDSNDDNMSSIPSTRATGGASGGGFDNASKDESFRDRDQLSDSQRGGSRDDQFGGDSQREREGGKPTFGDKMRGNVEKLAGTVSGKKDLRERGEERKSGGDF